MMSPMLLPRSAILSNVAKTLKEAGMGKKRCPKCVRDHSDATQHKRSLESFVGLRRDLSHYYSSTDPLLYRLAVLGRREDSEQSSSSSSSVIPLFGTVPALRGIKEIVENDLQIDEQHLKLGEHYFQLYRPLPLSAEVYSIIELSDVVVRDKGAMLIFDIGTRDGQDNFLMFNQFCYYVKSFASGLEGLKRRISPRYVPALDNNMCEDSMGHSVVHFKTATDQQAALSRLTGEPNPYLSNPVLLEKRKAASLPELVTVGVAGASLQQRFNIPEHRFKGIKVRFDGHIAAGDTLQIFAWRLSPHLITFNSMALETGDMVHTGGYITLY